PPCIEKVLSTSKVLLLFAPVREPPERMNWPWLRKLLMVSLPESWVMVKEVLLKTSSLLPGRLGLDDQLAATFHLPSAPSVQVTLARAGLYASSQDKAYRATRMTSREYAEERTTPEQRARVRIVATSFLGRREEDALLGSESCRGWADFLRKKPSS